MKKLLSLILMASAACMTPYQERGFRGGYSDTELGPNRFIVSFKGNGNTSLGDVYQMANRRAQEICVQHFFSTFEVLGKPIKSTDNAQLVIEQNDSYIGSTIKSHEITLNIHCR